jgi:hypothetical protein
MNEEKLNLLKASSKLSSTEDITTFENVLEQVTAMDLEWLSKLFLVFNDNCISEEVMFSLVHRIETFPNFYYVDTFMANLQPIYENSKYWTVILFSRMLNNEDCLNRIKKMIPLADKGTVLTLLARMEKYGWFKDRNEILYDLKRSLMANLGK